jgi:single-strand DNA-binding protein
MAGSINRIIIGGRLGADPEIRNVSDLKRVAKLSVATSESWASEDGEPKEQTQWHAVVLWKPASIDFAERNLKKGDLVVVEGQLENRSFDKAGVKTYVTEIVVRAGRGDVTLMVHATDRPAPQQRRAPGAEPAGRW